MVLLDKEKEQLKILRVTFLALIFVNDILITAGDDGYLYVWDDKKRKAKKKSNAHPGKKKI